MLSNMLEGKIDKLYSINLEMLNELKRMNEINAHKLQAHDKEFERIWEELRANEEARKKFYERFDAIEKTCLINHARKDDSSYQVFDRRKTDTDIVTTWLGRKLVIFLGLVISAAAGGLGVVTLHRLLGWW